MKRGRMYGLTLGIAVLLLSCGGAATQTRAANPERGGDLPTRRQFIRSVGDLGAPLDRARLDYVAGVIRQMARAPTSAATGDLHFPVMAWLVESPDVSVVLCGVQWAGRDPDSEPTRPQSLLTVFNMLTQAAYLIEHPGADPTSAEVQVAGMTTGLQIFVSLGGTPETPVMEELLQQLEAGTLLEWWERGVTCGS